MNDREIFRHNLNHYLSISGKMQKDLAEYTNVTTSTVSGWIHGISYPRADAMEKIAMFFGVPTSKIIGEHKGEEDFQGLPRTNEARILAAGIDKLPKEQREQALSVIRAMFTKYADYFEEGNE